MTADQLRQAWNATPFVPFTVHTTEGQSFRVPDRDHFHVFPNDHLAAVAHPSGTVTVLNILNISGLSHDIEHFRPIA
jgi:hypothetical protein